MMDEQNRPPAPRPQGLPAPVATPPPAIHTFTPVITTDRIGRGYREDWFNEGPVYLTDPHELSTICHWFMKGLAATTCECDVIVFDAAGNRVWEASGGHGFSNMTESPLHTMTAEDWQKVKHALEHGDTTDHAVRYPCETEQQYDRTAALCGHSFDDWLKLCPREDWEGATHGRAISWIETAIGGDPLWRPGLTISLPDFVSWHLECGKHADWGEFDEIHPDCTYWKGLA